MLKKLIFSLVAICFSLLLMINLVRYFYVAEAVDLTIGSANFFSFHNQHYYISAKTIINYGNNAPNFPMQDIINFFSSLKTFFNEIDKVHEVLTAVLILPVIPTIPVLIMVEWQINIIWYVIMFFVNIIFPLSSEGFYIEYLHLTPYITRLLGLLS